MTTANLIFGIFTLVPILVAMGTIATLAYRRGRESRTPIEGKMLRPPGHSLRLQMEKLDERLLNEILLLLSFGVLSLIVLYAFLKIAGLFNATLVAVGAFAVVFIAALVWLARYTGRRMERVWNLRLGYSGECRVAEELNKLMIEGCRVFHDVPGDGPWNVDHVVVGPNGVFVIETKTRRKKKAAAGKEDHKVEFDGRQLNFPFGYDTHGIEQARRNADWLSKLLTNALAEPVKTLPVLTLPGWFVTTRVSPLESVIAVVNPKGIPLVVRNTRHQGLTDKQIQQIAHQLDQRCRDVEF